MNSRHKLSLSIQRSKLFYKIKLHIHIRKRDNHQNTIVKNLWQDSNFVLLHLAFTQKRLKGITQSASQTQKNASPQSLRLKKIPTLYKLYNANFYSGRKTLHRLNRLPATLILNCVKFLELMIMSDILLIFSVDMITTITQMHELKYN